MADPAFNVASSLSKAQAEALLKKGMEGLLRQGLSLAFVSQFVSDISSVYTDTKTRVAEAERKKLYEKAQKAIPQLMQLVKSKNVNVPNEAFNSTSAYTTAFANAAYIPLLITVQQGVNAINLVGRALESVRDELSIQSVSRVQGWGEGGFGHYVHRFVELHMTRSPSTDTSPHYFFVWAPGNTTWHARFEERCRERPLGLNFGGYHQDLDTICSLMWSARSVLVVNDARRNKKATFHLLVPTFETVVIDDPIIFDRSLHPLIVEGDIYRGYPMVWLNSVSSRDRKILQNIGQTPDPLDEVKRQGAMAFCSCWLVAAMTATLGMAAATIFPPLLAYESYLATIHMLSGAGMVSSALGQRGTAIYYDWMKSRPRVLGPPLFVAPPLPSDE